MAVRVVIGASIINHLSGFLSNNGVENTISIPGLSFGSKKMKNILNDFRQFCRGKIAIKVAIFPLGNSMFPGIPKGPCYLKPRLRPLTALQMKKKTLVLLEELRELAPKGTKLSFIILPSLGRRPRPCRKACKKCICYGKFAKKCVKFERHMSKVKDENLTVVSVTEFGDYIIREKRTNNISIKRLKNIRHKMRVNRISEFSARFKLYSCISGLLLSCHSKTHCKKDPNKRSDRVHLCCNHASHTLAGFIGQCLAQ